MPSNHMLCIQLSTADDDDENVKNHQGSGLDEMFLKLKKQKDLNIHSSHFKKNQ